MSIDHYNENQESTEDDIYLAKMTMDEVGADIDEHGHIAVTDDNRTQDPFTTKGSLANALDEALDYSNPNYDPTNESQGEVEGVTQDPQNDSPKSSNTEIKPDDTTMDKAPELPESMDNNNEKTTKDSLAEALDSVVTMDAVTEVPGEADDDAHHQWEKNEIDKRIPTLPKSLGDEEKTDGNGLVYLEYTFTVDPAKYRSANYQPITNAADAQGGSEPNLVTKEQLFSSVSNDRIDEGVNVEETIEEEEPTAKVEKEAADEAIAKGLIDFATFIDGSSFLCNDEVSGIDYSKIAMDVGPKKAPTKQDCKTTFAQCRAKNPLFCRFHGPKLLEKDIKTAISAAVGKGCVVSVTKDKGNKNPHTFRLTVGCPPAMKKNVEHIVHMFLTENPGISSPEEFKDLGNGKQTTEFDIDILMADKPPKKNSLGDAAIVDVEKAKAKGKTMPVVGETPPSIEKKAANAEGSHKFGEEDPAISGSETGGEESANSGNVQAGEETSGEKKEVEASSESSANPTEAEVHQAAIAIANGSTEYSPYDEAYTALTGLLNGKIQGFGAMSADEMKKETAEECLNALKKDNENDHSKVIQALQGILSDASQDTTNSSVNEGGKTAEHTANEEKTKKKLEDEFNAALGEYSGLGTNIDNDASYSAIINSFTQSYATNSQEGMKYAIEAMKKLVSDVKGETNTSSNATSEIHYVDDAAMKMESELKDLAQENSELLSGDDNVSAKFYTAQTALDGMILCKQGLDELDAKIKAMGDNDIEMGASGLIEKKTLEMAKKQQQEAYDEAKGNAEILVKDFKAAIETAKNYIVDGIKGIQAGNVENIVKTTAMAIFPNGKPDGVDSVADMIDELYEEMTKLALEKLGSVGDMNPAYIDGNKYYGVGPKYQAVSAASLEFDAAVKTFKTEIDNAKDEASAKGLRSAVKEIGDKATALKDAFFAYKAAVDATKKEIETSAAVEAAKKKLSQNSGNDNPSQDEILDAAKKHAIKIFKSSSNMDSTAEYYAKSIGDVISGEGYPKNVDEALPFSLSRRDKAEYYLDMLKKLDGVSPSVIAALQKVVDMPKWGEKKLETNNNHDFGTDWKHPLLPKWYYQGVADAKEIGKKMHGLQKSFNFNRVFLDLQCDFANKMKSGKLTVDYIHDAVDALKSFASEYGNTKIKNLKGNKAADAVEELLKTYLPDYEKGAYKKYFDESSKETSAEKERANSTINSPINPIPPATSSKVESIKEKIAAMSIKEKMEKSIPILEKKIKAEPNNEKWQKMMKQAKAYLATHS